MVPKARPATAADLPDLLRLYRLLEEEMVALHPMWNVADGLAEPVAESLKDALADPETVVLVGELDDVAFGFILARSEPLLPQAGSERVGTIRLVYSEKGARGIGLGEVMRDAALDELREKGHRRFDAHVLPGHRLAKNFFEAGGFAARSIVMHRNEGAES